MDFRHYTNLYIFSSPRIRSRNFCTWLHVFEQLENDFRLEWRSSRFIEELRPDPLIVFYSVSLISLKIWIFQHTPFVQLILYLKASIKCLWCLPFASFLVFNNILTCFWYQRAYIPNNVLSPCQIFESYSKIHYPVRRKAKCVLSNLHFVSYNFSYVKKRIILGTGLRKNWIPTKKIRNMIFSQRWKAH